MKGQITVLERGRVDTLWLFGEETLFVGGNLKNWKCFRGIEEFWGVLGDGKSGAVSLVEETITRAFCLKLEVQDDEGTSTVFAD
jgi:hypothetical protein